MLPCPHLGQSGGPAVVLLASVLAIALPGRGEAGTYTLRADGTGDFPTIQAALDAVLPSDVVELMPGTYTGPGNRDLDPLGKAIVIRSQSGDPSSVILDAEGSPGDPHRHFDIGSGEGAAFVIEGLTLTGGHAEGSSPHGGAIRILEAAPTIRSCVIEGNRAIGDGGAIACIGSTGALVAATIEGCVIRNNLARDGAGIHALSLGAAVTDCVITGNAASDSGGGLFLAAITAVSGSTVAGNLASRGGGIFASASVALKRTIVWANGSTGDGPEAYFAVGASSNVTCSVLDPLGVVERAEVSYTSSLFSDPLLCDPADFAAAPTAAGTYTVDALSDALPAQSPCGIRIGALDAGCTDITPTADATWGSLKARYGRR
jgi:hypothetical protein